jgi:hypothetical protein
LAAAYLAAPAAGPEQYPNPGAGVNGLLNDNRTIDHINIIDVGDGHSALKILRANPRAEPSDDPTRGHDCSFNQNGRVRDSWQFAQLSVERGSD